MYRRDDEKLHYRDGEQAEHFSASQGAEQAGFSAQDFSEDVEDSCRRTGDVPGFWSRAEDVGYFWTIDNNGGTTCMVRRDKKRKTVWARNESKERAPAESDNCQFGGNRFIKRIK